jgi:hypothetical protein
MNHFKHKIITIKMGNLLYTTSTPEDIEEESKFQQDYPEEFERMKQIIENLSGRLIHIEQNAIIHDIPCMSDDCYCEPAYIEDVEALPTYSNILCDLLRLSNRIDDIESILDAETL